jgi:hypothetical protein
LFAYLKQANNTNMQRLFDMFVRSTAAAANCRHLLTGFVQTIAAATGFVEAHCKVCGPQDSMQ